MDNYLEVDEVLWVLYNEKTGTMFSHGGFVYNVYNAKKFNTKEEATDYQTRFTNQYIREEFIPIGVRVTITKV